MTPTPTLIPPSTALRGWTSRWTAGALLLGALALAGCAAPQQQATRSTQPLPFDQAVAVAADGLAAQARGLGGPFGALSGGAKLVADPMLDAGSGQQTAATEQMQRLTQQRLQDAKAGLQLQPFDAASVAASQYLLTGTMTRSPAAAGGGKAPLQLNLALTDLRSAKVVAQSASVALDEGIDHTPLAYYRDSPVLVKDRVIDGYVRTTATTPGQPADAYYLERLSVAPAVQQAMALVNSERYQDARDQYGQVAALPAGEQLRVYTGLYLTAMKLGRTAEAQKAFGDIVRYGIANQQLGVKFLFSPGGTTFWSDPAVSGPYAMWLREIARESTQAKVCMDVVGHTSRTGTQAFNDNLSLQRASAIRQSLGTESPALTPRLKASGRGFAENIVGSGTDNSVDALDRRVEFRIVGCPG